MPLDVWVTDDRGEPLQDEAVEIPAGVYRSLQEAAAAAGAKLLRETLRAYYGSRGDFGLSGDAARRAAEELERLDQQGLLPAAALPAARQLAHLCKRAAAEGLEVRGYAD